MADLIVLGFSNIDGADDVMVTLDGLQREDLLRIADWARVVRHDDGKIDVRQGHSPTAAGAGAGALWGLLIGLIFLMPLAGVIVGGATGALIGTLIDYGIDDKFIEQLGNQIQPGTSALFLYVTEVTMDRVAERLRESQPTVLHTSLSAETENQLRAALDASMSA